MATKPIPFGQGLQPFFKLPDHIKPPPGFPFVILPAEPAPAPPAVERRRLAENVICLRNDDRDKVTNIRWRGRYPRKVNRFRPWDRLHAGDYCMLWLRPESKDRRNHGLVVQLLERDRVSYDLWHVRAVHRPIHTHWTKDPENPEGHQESWECTANGTQLRRCAAPASGGRR